MECTKAFLRHLPGEWWAFGTLKYLRVVSVQTRHFTVSQVSWYDSFHPNSVPFLSSPWRGALKDESDGTNW